MAFRAALKQTGLTSAKKKRRILISIFKEELRNFSFSPEVSVGRVCRPGALRAAVLFDGHVVLPVEEAGRGQDHGDRNARVGHVDDLLPSVLASVAAEEETSPAISLKKQRLTETYLKLYPTTVSSLVWNE